MKGLTRAAIVLSAISVLVSYATLTLNILTLRKTKKINKISH